MGANRTWSGIIAVVVAGTLVAGCGARIDDSYVIENDPGKVEPIAGSGLARVSVTERAAERLGIQTTRVRRHKSGTVVPTDAIFVDTHGTWWIYIAEGPTEFVRHEITIARQNHRGVVLSEGPAPETRIVTVGVAELYGIEEEVGH